MISNYFLAFVKQHIIALKIQVGLKINFTIEKKIFNIVNDVY